VTGFTAAHRGGSGPPLVCLHGFADTWRTWELVLPALERRHDVLAPTLAGHAGGPPIEAPLRASSLADAVERAMDTAGFETAHLAGNSLGAHVALQLAARGRARSVVAFAPPGGAAHDDTLDLQLAAYEQAQAAAPHADAIMATADGRRRGAALVAVRWEHIPADLLAHQLRAYAAAPAARAMLEHARREGWPVEAEKIDCPVRFVWGTEDRLLPWPGAAEGYRRRFPHADWVELDGVGHAPQLDVPLVAADLILGFTS
jgi:pimeloyl-ACP methyl ester carboxylesterase